MLRRTTTSSGHTITVYAFELEEHTSFEADYYTALYNNIEQISLYNAIQALTPFIHPTKSTPNPDNPHYSRLIEKLRRANICWRLSRPESRPNHHFKIVWRTQYVHWANSCRGEEAPHFVGETSTSTYTTVIFTYLGHSIRASFLTL